MKPHKTENHRVRITAGDNRMFCSREKSTPISSVETIKMHWNSVISLDDAKHTTIYLKYFFLKLDLLERECVRIKISTTPIEFAEKHKLHEFVDVSGHVHEEVRGGTNGFPQVGRLVHEDLLSHLQQHDHKPEKFTPGSWKHDNNGTSFELVVDDFGVKFNNMK